MEMQPPTGPPPRMGASIEEEMQMPPRERHVDIEFRQSLGLSVTTTLTLLSQVEEVEGFDPTLYSMRGALERELASDIRSFFKPFGHVLLLDALLKETDPIDDLRTFIAWIGRLSSDRVDASNLASLRSYAEYMQVDASKLTIESLHDTPAMLEVLPSLFAGHDELLHRIEDIATALDRPEELKATLIHIVSRFWDRHYRHDYSQWKALEERSLVAFSQRDLSGDFLAAFREITGRDYPSDAVASDGIARSIFIPSCFPGPYLSMIRIHEREEALCVVYNCRPSGTTAGQTENVPIEELFAPLKALADESRLEILRILSGRELYAQEIVDRMNISQSAVSRHLRLMVACGVLNVRKHEGMKFYTINTVVLSRLGGRLAGIQGSDSA